jgi:hypothetical protein
VSPDTPIGGIVWVVGDVDVYRKHVDDLTRLDTGLVEHRTEAFRWSSAASIRGPHAFQTRGGR